MNKNIKTFVFLYTSLSPKKGANKTTGPPSCVVGDMDGRTDDGGGGQLKPMSANECEANNIYTDKQLPAHRCNFPLTKTDEKPVRELEAKGEGRRTCTEGGGGATESKVDGEKAIGSSSGVFASKILLSTPLSYG